MHSNGINETYFLIEEFINLKCIKDLKVNIKNIDNYNYRNSSPLLTDNKFKSSQFVIKELKEKLYIARDKIKELETLASQPTAEPIGDKELPPRTANNASKIISALASELLKMDLTQPYADDTNGKIKKAIERQGNQLGNDTIAYWLKLAHEQSI